MAAPTQPRFFAITGASTVRFADASAGASLPKIETPELGPKADPRHVFIVLVDDNPADVLLVREALSWHDVKSDLLVARDGDEAIRVLEEIDSQELPCPDLVVLDLNLPRKNGFEVLQRVRASARCRNSPVAILSSSDALSDRKRADLLGASQYFQKPSNLQDFMSIGAKLKDMLVPVK